MRKSINSHANASSRCHLPYRNDSRRTFFDAFSAANAFFTVNSGITPPNDANGVSRANLYATPTGHTINLRNMRFFYAFDVHDKSTSMS